MNIDDYIRNQIAKIRIENGYTERSLSLALHRNASYINKIENGGRLPSFDMLNNICEKCNTTLSVFFAGLSFENKHFFDIIEGLSKLDNSTIEQLNSISKSIDKDYIKSMIDSYSNYSKLKK